MATPSSAPSRVLDPQERVAEILFGVIMALSFTGTIEITAGDSADVRLVVMAALGCNIAWGVIDGVMYVVSELVYRGREVLTWRRFAAAGDDAARRAALAGEVPAAVLPLLDAGNLAQLQSHAAERLRTVHVRIHGRDVLGAIAVCLLVIAATFPVVLPYYLIHDLAIAKRVSNAVSIVMLFLAGATLGRFVGGRPLWIGLSMVALGVLLVGVTIALGG